MSTCRAVMHDMNHRLICYTKFRIMHCYVDIWNLMVTYETVFRISNFKSTYRTILRVTKSYVLWRTIAYYEVSTNKAKFCMTNHYNEYMKQQRIYWHMKPIYGQYCDIWFIIWLHMGPSITYVRCKGERGGQGKSVYLLFLWLHSI